MQRSQGLACGSGGSADFRPLERDFLTPCTQAINPTNRPKLRAPAVSQTLLLLLLLLLTAGSYASAQPCPCQTSARLRLNGFVGNTLNFAISNAPPGSKFDLYFRDSLVGDNWRWRRVFTGIQCDTDGKASFQLQKPAPNQSVFVLLAAGDADGDGLPDGYECFFTYNGNYTDCNSDDSDKDGLNDGWEIEYGLDPTRPIGTDSGPPYSPDGGKADLDSDGMDNSKEQQNYYAAGPTSWDASYDPLRNPAHPDSQSPYKGPNRPVITISADSPGNTLPDVASFTITRDLGGGVSLTGAPDLTVYYSLGGNLNYSAGDFTLFPTPPEWPRICSAIIKAGEASVTVVVQLAPKVILNGVQTVEVAVTPYGVSPVSQVADPKQWLYVADWKHNRVTLQFSRNPVVMPAIGTGSLRILSSGGVNAPTPLLELVRITGGGFELFLSSGINNSSDLPFITGSVSIGRYATGNTDNAPPGSIFLQIADALNDAQSVSLSESDLSATYGVTAIDALKTLLNPLWDKALTSIQKAEIIAQVASLTQFTLPTDFTWDFADDGIPSASQFQVKVNGTLVPSDVQQVGFKRRPLFAPNEQVDLRIENALYLKLAQPIPNDAVVEVTNPNWPATPRFVAVNKALRYSPVIHVNQEGYLPSSPQIAILGYYCGTLGQMNLRTSTGSPIPVSSVKLVDAATGLDVSGFTPVVRLRNEDATFSVAAPQYQRLIELDLNGYSVPGVYLLRVQGLGASFPFRIDSGTAMKFARTFALGLYHQRCGTANGLPFTRFTHGPCHTARASIPTTDTGPQDPFHDAWRIIASYGRSPNPYQTAPLLDNPETIDASHPTGQLFQFGVNQSAVQSINGDYTIDVSGGHHDAGDYSKYTINSAQLIHALVFAADNFPNVGDLDNLGIPESGDGKSDILQEAKWEADFLVKMQDTGTIDKNGQPVLPGGFYTLVYPREREYEQDVLPDHGDRQIVWPKTTAVTAAAVAALAEIGSSPRFVSQFPNEAATYRASAQMGWAFLINAILSYGKLNSYQALYGYGDTFTHNDELAWAAAAMFAAGFSDTRPEYDPHTRLLAWYPDPRVNGPIPSERCDTDADAPQCGDQSCDNAPCRTWKWSWWQMYEGYGCAARDYAFAVRSNRRTNGLDSIYLSKCQTAITAWGDSVRQWSGYNAYHTTVMTSDIAGFGWHPEFYFPSSWSFDIAVADQIEDHTAANRAALIENLNYEAGRNPNNVSFIPGLGWKRQRSVVNQYAWNDDRISPPSGNPIGSVAFEFGPDINNYHLNQIFYPPSTDSPDSFALYDRWADAFNIKTEFVSPQTARSLAVTALLAAENPALRQQPWCSANASIVFQNQNGVPKVALNSPAPVQLSAAPSACGQTTLDFSTATILWELQGQEPTFGAFTPGQVGEFRLEAEALFPDGRRVFAVAPSVLVFDPMNGGVPYDAATPNTVALYHFNGDFSDATGNGHTLTLAGGDVGFTRATWMRNPDFNTDKIAVFQNAGDQLQVSLNNNLIHPPLTIDARIFPRAFKGDGGNQLLSLWQASDSQFSIYYEPGGSTDAPSVYANGTLALTPQEWQAAVSLNAWHNIRITYTFINNTPSTTIYIDRTFKKAVPTPVVQAYSLPWILYIGNFDGSVDEVRISNVDRGPLQ